jgi:hypothetical protein
MGTFPATVVTASIVARGSATAIINAMASSEAVSVSITTRRLISKLLIG